MALYRAGLLAIAKNRKAISGSGLLSDGCPENYGSG